MSETTDTATSVTETVESPRPYDTQLAAICWSPRHDARHEIVGISRPASIGKARFYEELTALGWVHIGGGWRCPECAWHGTER